MNDDRPTVPCAICGTPTPMLGTKRCDPCWELESRITHDCGERLAKVLNFLNKHKTKGK